MQRKFPHLPSESDFPGVSNVAPWQYDNDNDYRRWNNYQMTITVCGVPWDLGEAHVGNRVIEGVGNVVFFGSEEKRNAYFDGMGKGECYRYDTKYRRFHSEDEITLPIPFASLADYNYIEVRYYPEPGTGEPLEGTSDSAIDRWYYFIRDIHRDASNATRCTLMMDTWQTCVYRIDVPYLFLKRGHWPIAHSDVDTYLADPIHNADFLTCEDVSYGDITQARHTGKAVLNDDVMACFVTSSNPWGIWGDIGDSVSWSVPAANDAIMQGAPSAYVFAVSPGNLQEFLQVCDQQAPQFKQTVLGVFFAPAGLLQIGKEHVLFGISCYEIQAQRATFDLCTLNKRMWGFPEKYERLAKLYTFPYSALDIYDEKGDVTRIHVEDTSGTVGITVALSIVWPWIKIDGSFTGIGSAGIGSDGSAAYRNLQLHTMPYSGTWYEHLLTWDVPIYGTIQSAEDANFSTYWDRQQTMTAAANQRASENASAATTQSNENANADLNVTNTQVQNTANQNINATSNEAAAYDTVLGQELNKAIQSYNAGYARQTTTIEIEGQQQQAAIGAAAGVVGGAASGFASGGPLGAVGGLISGAISGVSSMAQSAISANMTTSKAEAGISNTQNQVNSTNANNQERTSNQISANTENVTTGNDANLTAATNSAAVQRANASRQASTDQANATRSYNTSSSEVANQQRGARLGAPTVGASAQNGGTSITRPQAAFCTIVTQSAGAIAQAGDAFLRHGYRLERAIEFDSWVPTKKFCYWECSDMWLRSSSIPDVYMDQIRMLLFGGVTVWKDPADIGHTSIYDNF